MEKALRRALAWTGAVYLVNFAFLGFFITPSDYDHLSGYYEIAWRFWRSGGGLPHFNPLLCGGRTLGGDPQIPLFHPLILLVPIVGATWLIKLEMLGQLVLGVYGLRKWLAQLGATPEGVDWGTLLFAAGGGVVCRFLVGHVTLGFYLLMPLFFHLSYRLGEGPLIEKGKLLAAYLGLFAYAALYRPNFIAYGLPPLLLEHVARALFTRQWRVLGLFCAGAVFAGLTNAVAYLPSWIYFSEFPRSDEVLHKFIPPYTLLANLLMPLRTLPKLAYGGYFLQRHEYNYFIGPVALYFAWKGFRNWTSQQARRDSLLVFIAASIVIGIGMRDGSTAVLFPYRWLYDLWPSFKTVRVPVRFWFGAYLGLIVLSSVGWQSPLGSKARSLVLLLGIVPVLGAMTVNLSKTTVQATYSQSDIPREYPTDFVSVFGGPDDSYRYLRRGLGVIQCLYNLEAYTSPQLMEGPLLLQQSSIPLVITARWNDWHRFEVHATASAPFTIKFNVNHSPYWKWTGTTASITSVPRERLSVTSRLSNLDGELSFEQPGVLTGLIISLVTLSVFFVFLLKVRGLL